VWSHEYLKFSLKKKWSGYHPKNSTHSWQGLNLHHCFAYVLCSSVCSHILTRRRQIGRDAAGISCVIFISSCLNDSLPFIRMLKRRLARLVGRYATDTAIHMWDSLAMIGTSLRIGDWFFQARTGSFLTLWVEEWRYNHVVYVKLQRWLLYVASALA
jgi:hypothetical protein